MAKVLELQLQHQLKVDWEAMKERQENLQNLEGDIFRPRCSSDTRERKGEEERLDGGVSDGICFFIYYLLLILFICLAAPSLSCDTQDL